MDLPSDFRDAMIEAKNMHDEGRLLEAERIYRALAAPGPHRGMALEALSQLYLQQQRLDETHNTLKALTEEDPDSLHFCALLANFLDSVDQTQEAVDEYLRLLDRQPETAVAHFNLALLYRKQKRYSDALTAYEEAIRLDIDWPEEVYSNMGILYADMQRPDEAKAMYERALEVSAEYVPALYNLAGHIEEIGEKQRAIELYERILSIEPTNWSSLSRVAYARRTTSDNQDLIQRLERAIEEAQGDDAGREGLYFALGKAYDDLERYDEAAAAYGAANDLGKLRVAPYDQKRTETAFDQLIELFDAEWFNNARAGATAAPIFVCGMPRSGSTLLEQMLGAHASITVGGEIDVLPWLIGRDLSPYPQGVRDASPELLQRVRQEYLSRVRELFPDYVHITDKRPDNFLHLGLIKALFPAARIVLTRRNILDNCLSLFFQQFGRKLTYATDLESAAHYRQQHDRLIAHWMECFGEDLFTVDYEELIVSPEQIMRGLLDFLGLAWDPAVLEFQKGNTPVKTASLWQVRQALHTRSRGRWRNYEALLGSLTELASPDETTA